MNREKQLRHAIASMATLREAGKSAEFLAALSRALNLSRALDLWDEGKRAIAITMAAWRDALFASDEIFVLIRHLSEFHDAAGEYGVVVGLYLQAASYFADFEAYQSAYRLLNDAESYASDHRLPGALLEVRECLASIALFEGDLPYAQKAFAAVKEIRAAAGMPVPSKLLVNMATLEMRHGDFRAALEAFDQVLRQMPDKQTKLVVLLNSGACVRELGQTEEALSRLAEARALADHETSNEVAIELDLIESKTAACCRDYGLALQRLLDGIGRIEEMLLPVGRLHYRRGVRERYRQRVAALLCELPKSGASTEILKVIAFLKSNSAGDWMALLDWHDQVTGNDDIPEELRLRLTRAVVALAHAGAPALYGYREKYDDPWSTPWSVRASDGTTVSEGPTLPWPELNSVVHEIFRQTGETSPWHTASSDARAAQLAVRLRGSDAVFAVLFTASGVHVFLLIGSEYSRNDFSYNPIREMHEALIALQLGTGSRQAYMDGLDRCVDLLLHELDGELAAIAQSATQGILILPEPFELPLLASIMAHPELRQKAKQGKLAVRACPVLHPGRALPFEPSGLTACWYREDGLGLNEEEVQLVSRLLPGAMVRTLELPLVLDVAALLETAVVHIAAHGAPVSNFRDAFFASPHPKDGSLGIPELQAACWGTPHRIVFLNSCFSGDVLNWNYFHVFRTNEQIGIPATLLLNRRSVVIASTWKTFDVTAYLFAGKFYTRLAGGADPAIAFTIAAAELIDMTSDEVRRALEAVRDSDLRMQKQEMFKAHGRPFQHPYVSGTFQFVSLL
jgi:tetratricopeptide (TPR) repeat protein